MVPILIKNHNHLFKSIPDDEWKKISPHIEPVDLALGQVLYEPGAKMSHAYFPSTAVVSLLYELANGDCAEIALVGNEGVVGISIFLGGGGNRHRVAPL